MFIRWQSRERETVKFGRHRAPGKPDVRWTAILAESKRVDGKPRQQHVAYLGSITESAMQIMAQRCFFWEDVWGKLDWLGNRITAVDRERIETAIATKVPCPTPDEYKNEARRSVQMVGWAYVSARKQAVLGDEAEQWRDQPAELSARLHAAEDKLAGRSETPGQNDAVQARIAELEAELAKLKRRSG